MPLHVLGVSRPAADDVGVSRLCRQSGKRGPLGGRGAIGSSHRRVSGRILRTAGTGPFAGRHPRADRHSSPAVWDRAAAGESGPRLSPPPRHEPARDLLRIEGTGEIGLRVELLGPAAPSCPRETYDNRLPAMSAHQYLALRRQCYEWKDQLDRQAQRVTENFVQAVKGLYRQWRVLTSTAPTTLRLAFLVPRNHWEAFRNRLETVEPDLAGQRYTLVGPWPPYSFV